MRSTDRHKERNYPGSYNSLAFHLCPGQNPGCSSPRAPDKGQPLSVPKFSWGMSPSQPCNAELRQALRISLKCPTVILLVFLQGHSSGPSGLLWEPSLLGSLVHMVIAGKQPWLYFTLPAPPDSASAHSELCLQSFTALSFHPCPTLCPFRYDHPSLCGPKPS